MTDELTVQRRLTAVAYAQAHANSIGLACPICTLQIAKQIDEFLVTGDVPAHADHAEPEVEETSATDGNVTPFPKKPH